MEAFGLNCLEKSLDFKLLFCAVNVKIPKQMVVKYVAKSNQNVFLNLVLKMKYVTVSNTKLNRNKQQACSIVRCKYLERIIPAINAMLNRIMLKFRSFTLLIYKKTNIYSIFP